MAAISLSAWMKEHPFLRLRLSSHIFGQFVLGSDGIAEIALAASPDGCLSDGGVAVMRTLATVHLYGHFRTDHGADGAAGAFAAVVEGRGR